MDQDTTNIINSNDLEIMFYETGEFWTNAIIALIGIVIGGFSLYYSIKAFKEAKEAKSAAQTAAKTVRKQDIIVVLTELLNECQVMDQINFKDATNRYQTLIRKLNHITGLYSGDMATSEKEVLNSIETNLSAIKGTISLFNKAITPPDENTPDDFLHLQISPQLIELSGNIELLKGTLQDSLIN